MLSFLGSTTRLCDRLSRREMLRVGALAPLGLSLPTLLAADARANAATNRGDSFGKAKRCLMIFMWGGPAHQDLWDLKPHAPATVRGEFKPISTSVPGIQIGELLPNFARQMDKVALIRSVTHTDNNHSTGAHWMLTGHKHRLSAENFGPSPTDHPHIGSVIAKLLPSDASLPTFVSLPERIATTIGAVVPGQNGGLLGSKYDPLSIEQHPNLPNFKVDMLAPREGMDPVRVATRQSLLEAFNAARPELDASRRVAAMNDYYQKAADLVTSAKAGKAFDIAAEPDRERDRYGRGTFGQSLLLARRLLEAGVRLVTVYWHRDQPGVDTTWDTHGQNFKQLKERLCPQVDQPLATLLDDLKQRGLLDDTLVVWNSEFGRTPKINGNAGRDHWGPCNSLWLAGGGVPGGQVYGASDKQAAYVTDNPVTPGDFAATIFHLLGVVPHGVFHDRENRPHKIAEGNPLEVVLRGEATPKPTTPPSQPSQPPATPNPAILADSPLAYWPLHETTATSTAADFVELSLDRPLGKTPASYLGDPASGDQRMEVTLADLSDDKYTVEFCFRNTRPHEADLVTGYLFSREGAPSGGDRDRGEHLGIGGTYAAFGDKKGKLIVFNGDDSAQGCLVGRTVLEVGKWYHVTLTREGQQVRVYVNGDTTAPEISGELAKLFTTNHLFAATRSDGLFPMQGNLRDLAIFNGVLPAERIAAHYAEAVKLLR
jgi:hypothetical protein